MPPQQAQTLLDVFRDMLDLGSHGGSAYSLRRAWDGSAQMPASGFPLPPFPAAGGSRSGLRGVVGRSHKRQVGAPFSMAAPSR